MKILLTAIAITVTACSALSLAEGRPEGGTMNKFEILPVEHASLVVKHGNITIFVDPVGKAQQYSAFAKPDIILVTHIHRDHLDPDLIAAVKKTDTVILGPQSVKDQFKECTVIASGETKTLEGISIEAIPAYNLTKDRLKYHPKSRGDNGYVLAAEDERLYISGDTEDIREMRQLKDIDRAIICMNLPYTMTEEQAASAVLEMKPKTVIPYHFRGTGGISDLKTFSRLVAAGNKDIKVEQLDWYPTEKK